MKSLLTETVQQILPVSLFMPKNQQMKVAVNREVDVAEFN